MDSQSIKPKLFEIIEPVAIDGGFEVVDLALVREHGGWILRVYLDRLDHSEQVQIEDCARFSRELSAILDVDDPIPCAYNLEVSSPGVERPLRTITHFRTYIGEVAKIRLGAGLDGRRKFTGKIVGVGSGQPAANSLADSSRMAQIVRIEVDGTIYALPHADIVSAQIVPDWDKLLAVRATKAKEKATNEKSKQERAQEKEHVLGTNSTEIHHPDMPTSRDSSRDSSRDDIAVAAQTK